MPCFEGNERPQVQRIVPAPVEVVLDQLLDRLSPKVSAPANALRRQILPECRFQVLAQPQAHGWIQPHLGAPEDALRQPRFGGLPQEILGLGAAQFVLPGHAGRTLDEAVVSIGAADFEAVGHAHAIGITKDVVRQVGVQIDVADLIQ